MRYVRPFDLQTLPAGATGPWIVGLSEGLGVGIRGRRGGPVGDRQSATATCERFALVVAGTVQLTTEGQSHEVPAGAVAFVPAGASASIDGPESALWLEIEAAVGSSDSLPVAARVLELDPSKFEGTTGFAYQSLIDGANGCRSLRMNVLQVQPGAGSPDFHIHAFAQLYVILQGEMTLDIGRARQRATANSIVCLPPGVVHRNFNAASELERHITLLVPEPKKGEIFDYAVDIYEHEAELLEVLPT